MIDASHHHCLSKISALRNKGELHLWRRERFNIAAQKHKRTRLHTCKLIRKQILFYDFVFLFLVTLLIINTLRNTKKVAF